MVRGTVWSVGVPPPAAAAPAPVAAAGASTGGFRAGLWGPGPWTVPGVDVWALWAAGWWVVVPTNRRRRRDGSAVMGAGLAAAAADRVPGLDRRYGRSLAQGRDRVAFVDVRLLLVPTKNDWRARSSVALVRVGLDGLGMWCASRPEELVVCPALGCGLGGLSWPVVRDAAVAHLAGRSVVLVPPLSGSPRRWGPVG
jgi:hypothetical protein